MRLIVQKYGGTSVGSPERIRKVAERLLETQRDRCRVVAVISAMAGVTDNLLKLAREVSPQPHEREMDLLLATGEQAATALVAMAVNALGGRAISLTGAQAGVLTDRVHTKAKIVEVRAKRIHEALDEDKIVLVAGFQGVSSESLDVTTLGRGGSDTTAVALAAAVGADACEIYTDVEGIYTSDPRIVPEARKLHAVSYDEMLEMAASGAKVMALRSVEFARNHNVTLHVRSTFSEAGGTWIREEDERMLEKAMISGVTHTTEETVYRVAGTSPAKLFAALADAQVNVDTILQAEGSAEIVFSAPVEDGVAARRTLDGLGLSYQVREDLGKVSVVGAGMKSHPGIAAKTFATLSGLGIEPAVVSTSPIKIACHMPKESVQDAVRALHAAFELDDPGAERGHE
ncbi:MAG: aspartate kinase [Gaiellaceae bacterium]|nr:aspartate kinase [Gaiellaceae bacterium]